MGALFGKRPKQTSENKAYPYLKDTLSPVVSGAGVGGSNLLQSLLGIGGADPAAGDAGFDRYKDLGGFDFAAERGSRGVTGNAAARGMLNSGSTQRSLMEFGTGLNQQYLQNYIQSLLGTSGLGLQSAGIIGGAGGTQQSKGGKPGLLSLGASIAAGG